MISFDTSQIERAARQLERFRLAVPVLAGGELVRQVREFAASSKSPDGTTWKKLSPEYAKRKQRMGFPPVANKKVTGQFLASVKNRDMVVAPSADQMAKAQGLEKLRTSFQPSPITGGNVERLMLKEWNAAS